MRCTHYVGRYDGEGIEFACPRLTVELPHQSAATPALLLAALASPIFGGFTDVRFTSELWEMPPTTPAGDFNVMTHAWMFGHLDLAQKLQNHADVIIGAFDLNGIEATPAAAAAAEASSNHRSGRAGGGAARAADGDNKQAMPVDSVRRMRVSMHMKRGSPAFSPNNCKLRLKRSSGTCSFWLLKGDLATRRAVVSFVCLLPPQSNAAFVAIMAQQRHDASIAPDAPPGADSASLHPLLACLHSDPSVSDAAAALAASLIVSDDHTPLCAAETGAKGVLTQPCTEQSEDAAGGGGEAARSPAPTPDAIHAAIKGQFFIVRFMCPVAC